MPRWMNCLVSKSGDVETAARGWHGYGACGLDYWMREEVKAAVSRAFDGLYLQLQTQRGQGCVFSS